MANKNFKRNNQKRNNRQNQNQADNANKKIQLVRQNPDAIVYVFKSKNRNEYLPIVRNIDFMDIEIREEWGHGLSSDDIKKWSEELKKVSEAAEKVLNTALELGNEYAEFNIDKLRNTGQYNKINIIRKNPKADVIVINSELIEPLYEASIAIDVFDMPIKKNIDPGVVEERWLKTLNEFKEKIKETFANGVDLLIKAKTLPNGKVRVGEIRFPSLKKAMRIELKQRNQKEDTEENKETA